MSEVNGQQPGSQPIKVTMEQVLAARMKPVIDTVLAGIMLSSQGVPPDIAMRVIARLVGMNLAASVAGELTPVLKLRAKLKEEFAAGISAAEIRPSHMQQQPQPQGEKQ